MYYYLFDLNKIPYHIEEQQLDQHEQLKCEWINLQKFIETTVSNKETSCIMLGCILKLIPYIYI